MVYKPTHNFINQLITGGPHPELQSMNWFPAGNPVFTYVFYHLVGGSQIFPPQRKEPLENVTYSLWVLCPFPPIHMVILGMVYCWIYHILWILHSRIIVYLMLVSVYHITMDGLPHDFDIEVDPVISKLVSPANQFPLRSSLPKRCQGSIRAVMSAQWPEKAGLFPAIAGGWCPYFWAIFHGSASEGKKTCYIPWRIRMYAIYGLPFTINKNPSVVSIYTIRLDPMAMDKHTQKQVKKTVPFGKWSARQVGLPHLCKRLHDGRFSWICLLKNGTKMTPSMRDLFLKKIQIRWWFLSHSLGIILFLIPSTYSPFYPI